MAFVSSSLVVLAALSASAVPSHDAVQLRHFKRPQSALYTSHQVEFYLDEQQIEYIRPGLNIEVMDISIPADLHPVVELMVTDDRGQPLDREGNVTPGELDIRFLLAWYDPDTRDYTNYLTRNVTGAVSGTVTQATDDRRGTWEQIAVGHYRYRFSAAIPGDYRTEMTNTLGIYATRDLTDTLLEKEYVANVEYDFVPGGGPVVDTYQVMDNDDCNTCHDPLEAHGGSRRDVKLCVLCHTPQTIDPDTGNTVDMEYMVHSIHAGEERFGEPYVIIGYQGSVHNYGDVVFPQDIRNCTTCHDGPEGDVWMVDPTVDGCLSCHANIVADTGENHPGNFSLIGAPCQLCHIPAGDHEFDLSIVGAHTIPEKSTQLAGLNLTIDNVEDTMPGDHPTITFTLTNDAGDAVDPESLDRFSWLFGGPTTDYSRYLRENLGDVSCTGSTCMTTLDTAVPDDATGTWTFSADAYRFVVIDDLRDGIEVREAAFNPIFDAAVTDDVPMPRRDVVALDNCNTCHDRLALHGGQRFRIEECVICHNANETDASQRPASAGAATGIHFKWMIHKIHRGENLHNGYLVYGYHSSINDFSDVLFPGDLRDCQKCHVDSSYQVPVTDEALPTVAPNYFFSPVQPNAAACVSCHDGNSAAAHAYTNTAPFAESCASCHGNDMAFSVDKIHAR